MALVTRSPARNLAAPSTAPQEAMVMSLQKHIDELVQKNRASEHLVKKLQQDLSDEKERATDVVSKIRSAAQKEREEWKEGCDSLLGAHRIVHLRTQIELNKAQTQLIKEKEELRREQMNVLVRDYRLTLFLVKESQLEARVADLQDELEESMERYEQVNYENTYLHEETVASLNSRLSTETGKRKEAVLKLKSLEEELGRAKVELDELRETKTTLTTSLNTTTNKLDRASLQLDGAKTTIKELEATNSELQRTNSDLKRQLDQWQTLDSKGGAELEEVRKRRIELEVEVKELQERVKELTKEAKESARALEKEQRRVEKLKNANDKMANLVTEAQDVSEKLKEELAQVEEELAKTKELIDKLQSVREKAKGKARDEKLPSSSEDSNRTRASEREVELAITPKVQQKTQPKGTKRAAKAREPAESDGDSVGPASPGPSRKRKEVPREEPESEPDDPAPRKKGKSKATTAPSESEEEENTKIPSKAKGKGKAKESSMESANEKPGRAAKTEKDASDGNERTGAKAKPSSQTSRRKAASSQGESKNAEGDEEQEAQPKKRKKKIFGGPSKGLTFQWGDLPNVSGGLGIPTDLSPIKEVAPPRSVFGRAASALKWG